MLQDTVKKVFFKMPISESMSLSLKQYRKMTLSTNEMANYNYNVQITFFKYEFKNLILTKKTTDVLLVVH